MKKILLLTVMVSLLLSVGGMAFAQTRWDDLVIESGRVFEEMTMMPEEGIPEDLIKKCSAIAIFPSTIGGGFIVGVDYGQGVILAKDKKTGKWSAPAIFNLGGASFGWQIGAQATDTILLVMSERGLDGLLKSKFKLGADASVAAGPIGRAAEAATDIQLKGGILSYSRSKGAFIGLKLEGTGISFNREANSMLYNKEVSARSILIDKTIEPTQSAQMLLDYLRKY